MSFYGRGGRRELVRPRTENMLRMSVMMRTGVSGRPGEMSGACGNTTKEDYPLSASSRSRPASLLPV